MLTTQDYRNIKFSLKRSDVTNPAAFNQSKIRYYLNSWYRFLNLISEDQSTKENFDPRFFNYDYQFQHHWLLVLKQKVIHQNVFLAQDENDQPEQPYQYLKEFWIEVSPYYLDEQGQTVCDQNQVQIILIHFYDNEYEGFASPYGIKNHRAVYEQLVAIDRNYQP